MITRTKFAVDRVASIDILMTIPGSPRIPLGAEFVIHDLAGADDPAALIAAVGTRIRGVIGSANQAIEVDATLLDCLPALEIISVIGVGLDRFDLTAAKARSITIKSTPDISTEDVADLALALLLATVRRVPQAERFIRSGLWQRGEFDLGPSLRDRSVGIVGLGQIGSAFARRCVACNVKVAYFSRSLKDAPFDCYPSVLELASSVDTLVITAAGGPETTKLVNAEVIDALGPDGILINVARGSIVDEAALIQSLTAGRLLAAGLDVFESEPDVPSSLLALDNVVALPHIGSSTIFTRKAMVALAINNLASWFADQES